MTKPRGLVLLAVLLAVVLLPAGGSSSLDKKKEPEPHALLFGTIFTQDGLALPGVRVTIKRKEGRKPRWRALSDRRGEFAVRLPAGAGTYEVTTHSKDRRNETKTVQIQGEERVDIIFRLPLEEATRRKKK